MIDASPNGLMQAAACYRCLEGQALSVATWLAIQYAGSAAPVGDQITYTPDTAGGTTNFGAFADLAALRAIDPNTITTLNLSGKALTTLTNIHALPNLQVLTVNTNPALNSPMNLTANTALTQVRLNATAVPSINVSGLTNLTLLWCYTNAALTSLTLTGCTGLLQLLADSTGIASLNCTGLSSLVNVTATLCASLTAVNFSGCTSLVTINIGSSSVTGTVDVSDSAATLENLFCADNDITAVDLTGCSLLQDLQIALNANLVTLDVSDCTDLVNLNCQFCDSLSSLDCTNLVDLFNLNCSDCVLMDPLTLVNTTSLATIQFSNCTVLFGIDLTDCSILFQVDGTNSGIQSCDASGLVGLDVLVVSNCASLIVFSVAGCTAMTALYVNGCDLSGLDTSTCASLTYIEAEDQVGGLDTVTLGAATSYNNLQYQNNALPEAEIQAALLALHNNCAGNAGNCDFTTNTALTDCTNYGLLTGDGWTVNVDGCP